jgi:hypothetical protein
MTHVMHDTDTDTVSAETKRLADRLRVARAAAWAANPNPSPLQRKLHEAQQRATVLDEAQQPTPTRTRKRKPTVASVIRQMKRAGVEVAGCEVQRDGTVRIITGKPSEAMMTDNNDTTTPDPKWN